MKRLTAEWVVKAEADFDAAHELASSKSRLHDSVCFHCQQSAEKYLKALLAERGLAQNLPELTWKWVGLFRLAPPWATQSAVQASMSAARTCTSPSRGYPPRPSFR